MTVLTLVPLSNPILKRLANRINDFDGDLVQLIDAMAETVTFFGGIGLAAPQVGKSVRVIVFGRFDSKEFIESEVLPIDILVNPKIIKKSHELVTDIEGCLSLPGISGLVKRHKTIVVTGQDRYGKKVRIKTSDMTARVIQHEIDHLNGVLFIEIAKEIKFDGRLTKGRKNV